MTNEEIEKRTIAIIATSFGGVLPSSIGISDLRVLVAQAIREAVVQAYEECAVMCDTRAQEYQRRSDGVISDINQFASFACEILAEGIRSLKNSLTVEETAQIRRTENESRRNAK